MKHFTQNCNLVLQCRPWTTVVALQLRGTSITVTVSLDSLCATCAFGDTRTSLSTNASRERN